MASAEEEVENARLIVEYQQYMLRIMEDRRANPRDDMISDLVNTTIEDGRKMTDQELVSMIEQLLVAGNETTTSALTGGLLSLMEGRQYICGDRFTLADIQLYAFADFGNAIGQPMPADASNLQAWFARVGERPSATASIHPAEAG
jgi:glutathione S-transferase